MPASLRWGRLRQGALALATALCALVGLFAPVSSALDAYTDEAALKVSHWSGSSGDRLIASASGLEKKNWGYQLKLYIGDPYHGSTDASRRRCGDTGILQGIMVSDSNGSFAQEFPLATDGRTGPAHFCLEAANNKEGAFLVGAWWNYSFNHFEVTTGAQHNEAEELPLGTGGSATPAGNYVCVHPYYDCRIHWRYANTLYHFTPNLKTNYPQFQDPSRRAVAQWTGASDPNSPWHTHEVESAPSHLDVADTQNPEHLADAQPVWEGDLNGPPGKENPHFVSMRIRIDKRDVDIGKFYTGTGTPPWDKTDAWSLLAEEWGHVQNMDHFVPPGHEDPDGAGADPGHLPDHTMSGQTGQGQTDKRTLNTNERLAACIPYRQIHGRC